MNINNLISWSAAMLLVTLAWGVTACSNDADPSPRDWTNHVPVNKDDSLAVAYIYKALDYRLSSKLPRAARRYCLLQPRSRPRTL